MNQEAWRANNENMKCMTNVNVVIFVCSFEKADAFLAFQKGKDETSIIVYSFRYIVRVISHQSKQEIHEL